MNNLKEEFCSGLKYDSSNVVIFWKILGAEFYKLVFAMN